MEAKEGEKQKKTEKLWPMFDLYVKAGYTF